MTNTSTNATLDPEFYPGYPEPILTLGKIVSVAGISVGGTSNLIVLLTFAVSNCPHLQVDALIVNLCIIDTIYCLCLAPIISLEFFYGHWILSKTACRILPFFTHWLLISTIMTQVSIALNRYVFIAKSSMYQTMYSRPRIAINVFLCWAIPFLPFLLPLFNIGNCYGFERHLRMCTLKCSKRVHFKIILLYIPVIISLISYINIIVVVKRSRKKVKPVPKQPVSSQAHSVSTVSAVVQVQQVSQSSLPGSNKHPAKASGESQGLYQGQTPSQVQGQLSVRRHVSNNTTNTRKKAESKLLRMTLSIFAVFCISYLPFSIFSQIGTADMMEVHAISRMFVILSPTADPIIYVLMNKAIRKAVHDFLACKRCFKV